MGESYSECGRSASEKPAVSRWFGRVHCKSATEWLHYETGLAACRYGKLAFSFQAAARRERLSPPPERRRRSSTQRPAVLSVPIFGPLQRGSVGVQRARDAEPGRSAAEASRLVPSLDGDRPLGILAQGEAGDGEIGRLLLQAAGIGDHHRGAGDEAHEADIGQGLDQPDARRRQRLGQAEFGEARGGARVDREDDRQRAAGPAARQAARRRSASGVSTLAGRCSVTTQ